MAYFRGQLYVATSKGLWKYLNGEISKVKPDVFGNLQINSLHVHGNNLLIGTNGNGLWAYDIISLERLELNNSIDINQVLNIKPSLGETFWVLTNGALQKFYLDGKELLQIQALDLRSQIKSSEVTYMAEHNNELYILSKDGIYAFPAGSSKALEALKIVPLSLKVDNHLTSTKRIILLNEEQSLHFKFAAVNFSKHASKLSYRVNKGDWIETKDGNVFLNFNESGKYQLEVKGSSNFYKNSAPLVYTISVDGDFEWVLLVAFILALGVIVYLIFKLRNQVRFSPK
ncbi:MAG: ligand-binding sensor domain-containing protein [Lentimonas sp.]|jgi:ligand-binding sensor domain-containing protein